ncbi:cathepsin B [Acrasis kona]|uniref:Cathepsin B n=1 Tax=Acrasis kona TaxID=1008807 RepID=A0AAW2ZCV8_9EUKA
MMKVAILALAAIVSIVNAEIYTFCNPSQSGYALQAKNVVLSPSVPVSGQDFGVKIQGTMASDLTSGKAKVHVDYAGVELFDNEVDVCAFPGFKCPVKAGPIDLAIVQNIPTLAPPGGPYTGKVELLDQSGKVVTCINFNFEMGGGDNSIDHPDAHVLHDSIINEVNSDDEATWVAHRSPVFESVTIAQAKTKLGAVGIKRTGVHTRATNAPDNFDSRTQWPGCVHPVRNQQSCGSCWAFAASEVLSDRICIASKKSVDVILSPQYLVNCDKVDHGCQGGQLAASWSFLKDTGIPTDKCAPYYSGETKKAGQCSNQCADGSSFKLFKASSYKLLRGEAQMIEDIQQHGPIEVGFMVYRDFMAYKSGVYTHRTGALLGGHAVKIVGWGVDKASNTPYWTVQNSWTETFGEGGFFRIARGRDECGIESNVVTGTPAL